MFTLGELIVIELAVLSFVKDLDLSLQCSQEMMAVVGKCERNIEKLRVAAANIAPLVIPEEPTRPT